jgi:cellulose synthase/poly-beta-1,6-N-acetylglucosamine synthase-like glycosyltransferase
MTLNMNALLIAVIVVFWTLILYSLPLTLAGVAYQRARRKQGLPELPERDSSGRPMQWPTVTVLIPAHNEAVVIERSLRRFIGLDYPRESLDILVIDDASDDDTGRICDRLVDEFKGMIRVLHRLRPEGGQGKAAALNATLSLIDSKYIALYDADSRPRPDALKKLVSELETSSYAAAVGRLVKMNRRATLFNRFTSFEFTAFQWISQAGRGRLFDIVILTGTHFLIKTDAVKGVGGWDPRALTEDLELSWRLYAEDKRAVLVPEAVAEEQDPQQLSVWFKQRSRWLMGNFYACGKHLRAGTYLKSPRAFIAILEMVVISFVFLGALLISDTLLVAGLLGKIHYTLVGPYIFLWACALLIFVLTHQLSQAAEGEDSWRTPLIAALMYVGYTQLWLVVFFRSIYTYTKKRGKVAWVKTPRLEY